MTFLHSLRNKLRVGGKFILTTAHPFRFSIEKNEKTGEEFGSGYRDESIYTYPSTWDSSVIVSHQKPMISTLINSLISSGFRLTAMHEPDISKEHRAMYPHKAKWVDRYIGLVIYKCEAI